MSREDDIQAVLRAVIKKGEAFQMGPRGEETQEIEHALDCPVLIAKEYDTKWKMIRRRVDKEFPKGEQNAQGQK